MIEYQNIFTQVQVRGNPEWGMDNDNHMMDERGFKPRFSNLVGWIGNAQIGPIYLGLTGLVSLVTFILALNIVGFNMLAQVNWSIPEFLRQGFWLALEPPGPEHGLSIPPLNDGGWFIIASFLLLVSRQYRSLAPSSTHRCVKSNPVEPRVKSTLTLESP